MPNVARRIAFVRIGFGLIWAVDAAFKCTPMFYRMLAQNLQDAANGMPPGLGWWFHFWQRAVGVQPHVAAVAIAIAECLIALSLIFGVFLRQAYVLGGVFSLLIWGVGEAFGGPYSSMSTDIGAACVYAVVFALLFVTDTKPAFTLRHTR